MVEREQKRSPRSTLKKRREEVLERLAAFGLVRGPHRIMRAGSVPDDEASLGHRLRLALDTLGPIFASFGLYLATRVDLLAARDCLELAAITNEATPMSAAAAHELFTREIACAPEEAFLSFESEPFESRLLHQFHRARLVQSGMPVVVKLVRPEAAHQFLRDVELLDLLEVSLEGAGSGAAFKSALADFAASLGHQVDLTYEAKALETLQRDAEDFEMLRVPEVQRGLCAPSVFTVEHLAGTRLDASEFLDSEVRQGVPKVRHDHANVLDRTGLARLLCSAWLRQALLGHVFPAEPCPANIAVISDRQIAFTGGPFASLPDQSQTNLWNYLIASSGDNPDQACSCLLREVRREGPPGADEDLRHRFRQVVPFRDSGWYRDDDMNHLLEHLVVHWRAATECGYVPHSHLPSFYRGLFTITSVAQQLSAETDPLLEGLQETRLLASAARMREMLSLQHLGDHFDRYAAMMMTMPQRVDDMLTLVSEGGPRVKLHMLDTALHRRQKNSSAVVIALLLLLAAVAFALPRVTTAFVGSAWAGKINAIAFITCGALLLVAAGRSS